MRRFLECLIPLTVCNIKCSYCYVVQEGRRKNENAKFKYSPQYIGRALSKNRLGGESLISITASGETLIAKELPAIVYEILRQGHFVNITTNGILTNQLHSLIESCKDYIQHLHISFSFHYVELMRRDKVDTFFNNVKYAKENGASILLQINLVDEYIPYWDEIKRLSIKHVGALPQVALTRDESNNEYNIMSSLSEDNYVELGQQMQSPLFDFTYRFFNKKRREYCYAGMWSAKLNICTGEMSACYGNGKVQNIFKDVSIPIKWQPIGHHCRHKYCINSSHFISQGIIPSLLPITSYGELRNREEAGWYSKEMKAFLYSQFEDTNPILGFWERMYYDILYLHTLPSKFVKRVKAKFYRFL